MTLSVLYPLDIAPLRSPSPVLPAVSILSKISPDELLEFILTVPTVLSFP